MADELTVTIARVLREHTPTTGMSASGVTCRCGYWNGDERPGVDRPVGLQGLQWHQAEAVRAALGETAAALRAELRGRIEGMFLGAPTRWVDGKECVDVPVSEFGELLAALTAQGVSE